MSFDALQSRNNRPDVPHAIRSWFDSLNAAATVEHPIEALAVVGPRFRRLAWSCVTEEPGPTMRRMLTGVPAHSSSDYSISVSSADPALAAAIERGLTAHNLAATGVDEEKSFAVRVDAPDGSLVGGLTGWIWGYTAGISTMWLRDDSRRVGWGGRLLAEAEAEVRRHRCLRLFVSSFTFQAPEFYRRHGFLEIARVPGLLADGVEDIWFVKVLD